MRRNNTKNEAGQSMWTLTEDESVHAHRRQEAFKVAEMISRDRGERVREASEQFEQRKSKPP